MRRTILTLTLLIAGQPALAATHHATPATLWTTVAKTAKAGDVVVLEPGSYGDANFFGIHFAAPGIVIQGGPGVLFNSIFLNTVSGFDIRKIEIVGNTYGWSVTAKSSSDIRISEIYSHNNETGVGSGVLFQESHNVSVENSVINHRVIGVGVIDSKDGKVIGNDFSVLSVDGVDVFGSSNVLVEKNSGKDFDMSKDSHPDFIQFAPTKDNPHPAGLTVRQNSFQRGKGTYAQGVFGTSFSDVVIEGNSLLGTMPNGISVGASEHVSVTDNLVQGWSDTPARIIVRQGSKDVTVANNWASQIIDVTDPESGPNQKLTISGTHKIGEARPDDAATLSDWKARRPKDAAKAQP